MVHILEAGDAVGDAAKADDTAGEKGHQTVKHGQQSAQSPLRIDARRQGISGSTYWVKPPDSYPTDVMPRCPQ